MVNLHQAERRAQHRHRHAVLVHGESVFFGRAELGEQDAEADRVGARRFSNPYPVEPPAHLRRGYRGDAHLRELPAHPDRHGPRLLAELAFEYRPVSADDAIDVGLACGSVGLEQRDGIRGRRPPGRSDHELAQRDGVMHHLLLDR